MPLLAELGAQPGRRRHLVLSGSASEFDAELFLSRKTVETHMRHLFQKLDVSSRVEVARAVERAERGREPAS